MRDGGLEDHASGAKNSSARRQPTRNTRGRTRIAKVRDANLRDLLSRRHMTCGECSRAAATSADGPHGVVAQRRKLDQTNERVDGREQRGNFQSLREAQVIVGVLAHVKR